MKSQSSNSRKQKNAMNTKRKIRLEYDSKMKVKNPTIKLGDTVLLRQSKTNKLFSIFFPDLVKS